MEIYQTSAIISYVSSMKPERRSLSTGSNQNLTNDSRGLYCETSLGGAPNKEEADGKCSEIVSGICTGLQAGANLSWNGRRWVHEQARFEAVAGNYRACLCTLREFFDGLT